jgi:tRNA-2-methylthio-N6-dimethylallyladenosine synthase
MTKKLYIETVGCQMNVLDSEMVVASLRRRGFELSRDLESADVLLFNTCSVREQAENKTYSALGRLRSFKKQNPDKIIGVMGCMAQKDQQLVFNRAPFVDLVVGPGQLAKIPDLLEEIAAGKGQQMAVGLGRTAGSVDDIKRSHETFDPLRDPTMRPTPFQAYLRIQIGCDKFCTYCVVPNTRGPEQGRPPAQIIEEARLLAEQGCLEIILLGQTVNSYKYRDGGKTTRLSDLLHQLHEIDGIKRLKFVTNYPKDMTDDLLQTVRDLPKCSPYLHVPAQSGSNTILKKMKRGYTIEEYREVFGRMKAMLPEAAITSDFIVGFSGETDEDFQLTYELVKECRYKNSFIFKYSERPGTKAVDLYPDDIPHDVKQWRNNELLELTNKISEEENHRMLGQRVEVLVEGPSEHTKKELGEQLAETNGPVQLVGRTPCDRIVVFEGNQRLTGQIVPLMIYEIAPHTLFGAVATQHVSSTPLTLLGA